MNAHYQIKKLEAARQQLAHAIMTAPLGSQLQLAIGAIDLDILVLIGDLKHGSYNEEGTYV